MVIIGALRHERKKLMLALVLPLPGILSCRIDVFDIRVSQSERMGKVRIAGFVDVVNASVIERVPKFESVSAMGMIGDCGGENVLGAILSGRGGITAKHLARVFGLVLAMVDINIQLRLALLYRNQRRKRFNCQHS